MSAFAELGKLTILENEELKKQVKELGVINKLLEELITVKDKSIRARDKTMSKKHHEIGDCKKMILELIEADHLSSFNRKEVVEKAKKLLGKG